MKKVLAIVMLLVLLVGMAVPVFAEVVSPSDISSGLVARTVEPLYNALLESTFYNQYSYRAIFYYHNAKRLVAVLSKSSSFSMNTQFIICYSTYNTDGDVVVTRISVNGANTFYYSGVSLLNGYYVAYYGGSTSDNKSSYLSLTNMNYIKNLSNLAFPNESAIVNNVNDKYVKVNPDLYSPWILNISFLNYAFLQALINQAQQIPPDDYTPETWQNLQQAITNAQSLIDNATSQPEIDAMRDALQAAINGLTEKPPPLPEVDISELVRAINDANAIEDIGYTVMSWYRLRTSVYEGEALLARPSYIQPEVDTATVNIRSAISGLVIASTPGPPPEPGDHRYLVDGVQFTDLIPARDAILENMGAGQKFGLFVFAVLLALSVMIRIIKRFVSLSHAGNRDRSLR